MKLPRSTVILINVTLVLAMLLLVRALVSPPRAAAAAAPADYKVVHTNLVQAEAVLEEHAKEGWRFVTWGLWTPGPNVSLLFER
jgi:hypothetical protein